MNDGARASRPAGAFSLGLLLLGAGLAVGLVHLVLAPVILLLRLRHRRRSG